MKTKIPTMTVEEFEASNPPPAVYWVQLRTMHMIDLGGRQVRRTTFRWEVAWWKEHRLSHGDREHLWDVAGAWQTSRQLGIVRVGPCVGNSPRDMLAAGVLLDLPR